ncbi:alpha/beta hydrolase family protein [Nocardia fluminea]|uniref:alpha/beta hydrolase family protein n=1 Tax=Nocardia fluminea TaxID=134984 RepID=UPI003670AF6B
MNAELVESMFSRATGAGIDPHDYRRACAAVATPADWAPACAAAAERYRAAAQERVVAAEERVATAQDWVAARQDRAAATQDRVATEPPTGHDRPDRGSAVACCRTVPPSSVTRGENLLMAARWAHLATLIPDSDHPVHAAAADSDAEEGFSLLEPGSRRITGRDFTGILRGPAHAERTVIVVPGLDSSKDEFHVLADALVRRGAAVFAMDGPGQGALAATSTMTTDYPAVIGAAIDALGAAEVGVVGLSLGGYYAAAAAALDPRITVAATVSGPFRLDWPALPDPIVDLIIRRAGSREAAEAFALTVDLTTLAPALRCPLLVVDGADDVIPGVTDGAPLAHSAPRAHYLRIPGGDHLVGNNQSAWLPVVADHLTEGIR